MPQLDIALMMPAYISSMSEGQIWTGFAICIALGIGFIMVFATISWRRSLRLIENWARLHEVTILSIRRPMVDPVWKSGRGWEYYRATLRGKAGDVRECWIRCPTLGLIFVGKGTDYVEVVDDKQPEADQPRTRT